ncbi:MULTISPECIES: copper chaperone CopZ [Salimicrobium]|uniref:Copper chaperone CopZ n=4 Tax=Salimicrobium TaxID=351195 RepID=K2G9M5_9BACI|nr:MULTISPECIES: copper chaperone CopZ [Salimicrobium]AKG05467.1 copper-binding protein [Salimicrobium jeotgali]EKE31067.1 mercuric ion-binding protein [Salimicrobium jeotgali]MBM7697376.1 copper chaperone [Salimicrobium jeotgali]PBB05968.1 copper chaperone [Salimicrobium humidisoli]SDY19873.1 copper chaperone [Salimicrobium album]
MEKTLNVEGMTCGHCESAVKGALAELDGVKEVQVSLDTGKVDVTYEEGKVTDEQMKDAVEEQGYDVK